MRGRENFPRRDGSFRLITVRARCNVCEEEYMFFAANARAQLACPRCQEISKQQFKLAERGTWKHALRRWLDQWLLELAIGPALLDLARLLDW